MQNELIRFVRNISTRTNEFQQDFLSQRKFQFVYRRVVELGIIKELRKFKEKNKTNQTNITKEYRCTWFFKSFSSIQSMNNKKKKEKKN